MNFPEPRFVDTNGVRLAVFEAKPAQRTRDVCIVLCHGFPELGFSWRHQLGPLAEAGFHVMAPDLRGYGQSTGPDDPEGYTMGAVTRDIAGLIADAGYDKAVIVGHDFGGFVSWMVPHYQPDRVAGVITLNTPFAFVPMDPAAMYLEHYGPRNYVAYFKTKACEAELNRDTARSFRFFMRRDTGAGTNLSRSKRHDPESMAFIHWFADDESTWPGEVFLTHAELDYFAKAYAKAGFGGGLNWYRSIVANWKEQMAMFPDHPALPDDLRPQRLYLRPVAQRRPALFRRNRRTPHHRRQRPLDPAGTAGRDQPHHAGMAWAVVLRAELLQQGRSGKRSASRHHAV